MQAPIDRWLSVRRLTLSPNTVDHQVVSLRHFMTHLARSAPEVRSFADVTRDQALGFVAAMAEDARSLKGTSLSIYARRARIAAVVAFFRDAIAWGWSDMPRRPLLDHRDMPRMPRHIPRYIPADELARLMTAVASLLSLSTRGSARRPLVGRAPWGDMPARGRLPRRLPGRHSPAPHPGRQDAEGAGRATPRRSC
jgi:integrase